MKNKKQEAQRIAGIKASQAKRTAYNKANHEKHLEAKLQHAVGRDAKRIAHLNLEEARKARKHEAYLKRKLAKRAGKSVAGGESNV
jgi:hypothetical protein